MTFIALTIAGSDSGGGAGIQADLKTFSALGVYGASVLTALTAQNTLGVTAIHDVPPDFIRAQMDAVFSDLEVDAVKIGMLSQPAIIEAVALGLKAHEQTTIILDPVMVAESGDTLLAEDAVQSLVRHLFPIATLITPNLHEAAKLLGCEMAEDAATMEAHSEALLALGAKAVLLKGGHSSGSDAADFLLTSDGIRRWYSAPFVDTKNTHGTGCSLSSAIASNLAKNETLEVAVDHAKLWLTKAIAHADELQIGKGAGPVHHFHAQWKH
ncbi:MAG: bifunctional hydroxymethylpyrimidine kinase/phosphomethylpyrimidine kinase [Rhizobiaceae bacterium]